MHEHGVGGLRAALGQRDRASAKPRIGFTPGKQAVDA
jgi:hypothetical protein